MRVDLHIHSTFSDSSRSPEEIVLLAKRRNVSLLSVCDHATIDAYGLLPEACRIHNMQYVIGVELSGEYCGEDYDVLAYNFDPAAEQMKDLIARQHRDVEREDIVYNLSRDYPQMSLDDYRAFSYPKDKGGWKYIYYAVAKGAAATYEEAAHFYGSHSMQNEYSGIGNCDIRDLCAIVKDAGGVPVLAHPGYIHDRNPDAYGDFLQGVLACGIGGVECYYPSHSRQVTQKSLGFCRQYGLCITGGCDCHGDYDTSEGFSVGALNITMDMLNLRGIV